MIASPWRVATSQSRRTASGDAHVPVVALAPLGVVVGVVLDLHERVEIGGDATGDLGVGGRQAARGRALISLDPNCRPSITPDVDRVRARVVKNKVAPPFKQAEFDILYGQGISKEGSLIDMGVNEGFIRKSGSWFTYEGDQLGQGKENARQFLKDNPDLTEELDRKIK